MSEDILELLRVEAGAEVERLSARVAVLASDRRERIATACLSALEIGYLSPQHAAKDALRYADAIIEEIDKEAKP
jgi:hypothetical protein